MPLYPGYDWEERQPFGYDWDEQQPLGYDWERQQPLPQYGSNEMYAPGYGANPQHKRLLGKVGGALLSPPGLSIGLNLASNLLGLGDKSGAEYRGSYLRDRTRLTNMLGRDILNPFAIDAAMKGTLYEDVAGMGDKLDQSLGFDTGMGRGALYESMLNERRKALLENILRNAQMKSQRDMAINQALLASSAGLVQR